MSEAVTRGVRVRVAPTYLRERSRPEQGLWLFAYTVEIRNEGAEAVQLVARRWVITDAHGEVEEVEGPGVVGEQPWLPPGESFVYTSGCPLRTSLGAMEGHYLMVTDTGDRFEARIAPFTLADPDDLH